MKQTTALDPITVSRDQILSRLWHLANLSPEQTRGSISGQVKALSMIIAIENLIPGHRPAPATPQVPVKPVPPPVTPPHVSTRTPAINPFVTQTKITPEASAYDTHLGPVTSLRLPVQRAVVRAR